MQGLTIKFGQPSLPTAEAELRKLKTSELKAHARVLGVAEHKLDNADDADDVEAALIAIIIQTTEVIIRSILRQHLCVSCT